MPHKIQFADWMLLACLVIAWGGSFAMTKVAVAHLDAAWIMALRLSVAAVILVPYAYAVGQPLNVPASTWRKYAWLGAIGHTVPFFLVTWGMHFVASGVAGLLMGTIPLFLVVLAHFTLADERLSVPKAIGFLLGFAGIVVLIGPSAIFNLSLTGEELKGELAILCGCLCYAVHGILAKRLGFDHPAKQSAGVCLLAALMGLAFAALSNPSGLAGPPMSAFVAVAGLGIVPTAIATLLVYRLMNRTGPSFVAYSNYLVPVFAVSVGAVALGEELHWNVLLALLLILAGIAVSRMAPRAAATPQPSR